MPTPCLILALLVLLINSVSCFSPTLRASRLGLQKNRHPSAIFSTIDVPISEQEEGKKSQQQLIECQGCNATFASRNALFRHLRGEDEASFSCSLSMATSEEELLMATVIRYGYYYDGNTSMVGGAGANEIVANIVYKAFVHQMNTFLDREDHSDDEGNMFSSSALTYSSAAKMRQPSLGQDEEVICATAEVLSFNYILINKPLAIKRWKEYASSGKLQQNIQSWLDDESNCQVQVKLHMMDALVPRSSKFYAERSATQYCYRYILPVTWVLPDDKERRDEEISKAVEWWRYIRQRGLARKHEPRNAGNTPECPTFIQRMKQALKSLESETVGNRRVRRQAQRESDDNDGSDDVTSEPSTTNDFTTTRLSPGRFGQLWRKQKRCWSNFASGSGMMVSPGKSAFVFFYRVNSCVQYEVSVI